MNVKEKIQTVLQKLKLFDKAKANTLTNEDWQSIVNSYQQEYKVTLQVYGSRTSCTAESS